MFMVRVFGVVKLLLGIALLVFVHVNNPSSILVGVSAGYLMTSGLLCSIIGRPI